MKKIVPVIGSVLLLSAVCAFAADASSEKSTVAVVNVQQLFQESPKIAALNKKLQATFKGRQDKLLAAQKSLQDELEKYKKDSDTMSAKDKDAAQKKVAADQASLSKDASSFQQDLSKEQGKVMKNVLVQLNDIISAMAKKEKYTLVLDTQAVIYSAEGTDITKQVSKAFDLK